MTTRIASGERRHKLAIRSATEVADSHGQLIKTYSTTKTVWGRVKQLSGKEAEIARQIVPSATHEVVIPYWSGLTEEMQFLVNGRTLGIASIDDRDMAGVEQVCICEEAK